MNKTSIKDPILDEFFSRAKEMEQAAGVPEPLPPKPQKKTETQAI
mgnify:CR=1 FL=1|jgi:hypothetical protein